MASTPSHRRRRLSGLAAAGILVALVASSGIAVTGTAVSAAKPKVVSSDPITRAAQRDATRYWTKARMAAAKPYPILRAKGRPGTQASSDEPTGPAGKVAGKAPTSPQNGPAQPKPVKSAVAVAPQVDTFTYPFPFTRYFVDGFLYGSSTYGRYPYIAVGKVFFTQNGGNYVCSASSVTSAPNQAIWTAGHCLSNGAGVFNSSTVFVPAYRNGLQPYGTFACTQLWTSNAWHNSYDFTQDLGACSVGTNALGQTLQSRVGTFGFAWNQSRTQQFSSFGYPQAAPFDGKWMVTCEAAHATDDTGIAGVGADPIGIGCDMTGGSSGGPWLFAFHNPAGYINGHNDYKYTSSQPLAMYSPYFDTLANQIRCGAATGTPSVTC